MKDVRGNTKRDTVKTRKKTKGIVSKTKTKKVQKKASSAKTTVVVNVRGGGGGSKGESKKKVAGLWHNDKGNRSLGRAPAFAAKEDHYTRNQRLFSILSQSQNAQVVQRSTQAHQAQLIADATSQMARGTPTGSGNRPDPTVVILNSGSPLTNGKRRLVREGHATSRPPKPKRKLNDLGTQQQFKETIGKPGPSRPPVTGGNAPGGKGLKIGGIKKRNGLRPLAAGGLSPEAGTASERDTTTRPNPRIGADSTVHAPDPRLDMDYQPHKNLHAMAVIESFGLRSRYERNVTEGLELMAQQFPPDPRLDMEDDHHVEVHRLGIRDSGGLRHMYTRVITTALDFEAAEERAALARAQSEARRTMTPEGRDRNPPFDPDEVGTIQQPRSIFPTDIYGASAATLRAAEEKGVGSFPVNAAVVEQQRAAREQKESERVAAQDARREENRKKELAAVRKRDRETSDEIRKHNWNTFETIKGLSTGDNARTFENVQDALPGEALPMDDPRVYYSPNEGSLFYRVRSIGAKIRTEWIDTVLKGVYRDRDGERKFYALDRGKQKI